MVQKELFGKVGSESKIIDKALTDFIRVKECGTLDASTEMAIAGLGEGEKQSISLACNFGKDVLLLLDDRAGRRIAKKLNIPTTGLIGLLLISKEKGIVNNVSSLLYKLRNNGYWLSDDVIKIAQKLSGE